MSSIIMAIWFILFGVFAFVSVPQSNVIMAVLAVVVGVLVLVGR